MNTTLCDGCGEKTSGGLTASFIGTAATIERAFKLGLRYVSDPGTAGPWDFCSAECLAVWAKRKADAETKAEPGGRRTQKRPTIPTTIGVSVDRSTRGTSSQLAEVTVTFLADVLQVVGP